MKHISKILIFSVSYFCLTLSIWAQPDLILSVDNQKVIGNEFYFDIYFNAPNDDIFVGNTILLLEFNNNAFSNPNVFKDPLVASDGGHCNFVPISTVNEDIIQTRNKYFNNSNISLLGNEIEIVVSIDAPLDADEFNSSIARIDDQLFRLGTFKVDGLVDPSNIELRWKETCPTCLSYSEVHTIDPTDFTASPSNILTIDPEQIITQPGISLSIKLFLEGSYNQSNMLTNLQNYIPLENPYQSPPWNYPINDAVASSVLQNNSSIVDWILIELRSPTETNASIAKKAALLNNEGFSVDLDGISDVAFSDVYPGLYYIVVHHRNHLSVMSSEPVFLSN